MVPLLIFDGALEGVHVELGVAYTGTYGTLTGVVEPTMVELGNFGLRAFGTVTVVVIHGGTSSVTHRVLFMLGRHDRGASPGMCCKRSDMSPPL